MDLSSCLSKRWLHSHEEDTDEFEVYRPAGYPFPPARGRRGLEFRENGEFVAVGYGRGDAPEERPGTWRLESPTRVVAGPATLDIAYCDDEILKVRRA
jgi:hypothetical protein